MLQAIHYHRQRKQMQDLLSSAPIKQGDLEGSSLLKFLHHFVLTIVLLSLTISYGVWAVMIMRGYRYKEMLSFYPKYMGECASVVF
jgi:hypothetical protein